MADISLMGYNYRIDELRAEAERMRLVRDAIEAQRAQQPARRGVIARIRDVIYGVPAPKPTPVAPEPVRENPEADPTGSADVAAETEQARIPVGSRS